MKQEPIWRCDLVPQFKAYEEELLPAMLRVLNSGRYTLAEEVRAFEDEFAGYLGVRHAIGVADATEGLILSLKVLGIGPGDEVITTPYTAIPTVSAIVASGATPVFVDIDPDTYLIDLEQVAGSITEKTKAVMPVHIFGSVVDIRKLRGLLPERIRIIEDAAQAHGSTIDGVRAGSMGDLGVFSFYPTKNLGGYGDGGAIVTGSPELNEKLRLLRMYGMVDKDRIVINGVNSRLDELQAAILRVKLRHLDAMNENRNRIARRYYEGVRAGLLEFQRIPTNVVSNFHVFVARVNGDRDRLIAHLEREGIQSNIYYVVPLHLQEANRHLGYKPGDLPVCEALCEKVIALPLYPELAPAVLERVIEALNTFGD